MDIPILPDGPAEQPAPGLRVWISDRTLQEVRRYAAAETSRELPGFLVGEVLHGPRGQFLVIIRDWMAARHTAEEHTEATFTYDTWQEAAMEMQGRFPGLTMVGWFNTHPGFGVLLSTMDLVIHRTHFHQPWQVALVFDPRRGSHGLYVNAGTAEPRLRTDYVCFSGTAHLHGPAREERPPARSPCAEARQEVAAFSEPEPVAFCRPARPKSGRLRRIGLAAGMVLVLMSVLIFASISSVYREVATMRSEMAALRRALDQAGSPVTVPSPVQPPARERPPQGWPYTVRSGDTLWTISEQFYGTGAAAGRILAANGLQEDGVLQPGQRMLIPWPAGAEPPGP